jgi:hypothetical protein
MRVGVERVRQVDSGDGPFEVPVIELPDGDPLAAYVVDPVGVARSADHGRGIARTEVIQVTRVGA